MAITEAHGSSVPIDEVPFDASGNAHADQLVFAPGDVKDLEKAIADAEAVNLANLPSFMRGGSSEPVPLHARATLENEAPQDAPRYTPTLDMTSLPGYEAKKSMADHAKTAAVWVAAGATTVAAFFGLHKVESSNDIKVTPVEVVESTPEADAPCETVTPYHPDISTARRNLGSLAIDLRDVTEPMSHAGVDKAALCAVQTPEGVLDHFNLHIPKG